MAAGTKPGYEIGRNETGLTNRERQVLGLIVQGLRGARIASEIGVTKQRVDQIEKALVVKGALARHEHEYVVTIRK